ncbi:MAG: YkgJ family cysteine cluster protein [Bacteroidales bacterium]
MHHLQETNEYFALRKELDAHCRELSQLHESQMVCGAGCDQCCMDFSIFPVEYHAIKMEISSLPGQILTAGPHSPCPFLVEHRCTIYSSRPLICRTQGLPLLFMNEDQWELSACELNFQNYDLQSFTAENTFPQDRFNSRLFLINKSFLESFPHYGYQHGELIAVRSLVSENLNP